MRTLLLALMMSLFLPNMALAHVKLLSSSPAEGSVLEASPKTIELGFSQAARIISVTVKNAKGEKIETSNVPKGLIDKAVVEIPTLEVGDYTITWRGASKDMHAMSGEIRFTVK